MIRRPPRSTRTDTLFPYTTLFRSQQGLRLAPLSQFDPSGLVAMARSAGCSVRTLAPYTLSTRKLGMVSIQEYQISSSCTVFNADNQPRSEEHTSEPVTNAHLVCRLLLEKKKHINYNTRKQLTTK